MAVFGRDGAHLYDPLLEEWQRASTDYRAMARNIMHDHRVTPEREREFDRFTAEPRTADDLHKAITDYRKWKVDGATPDFLDPTLNGSNMLLPSMRPAMLATVVCLNALVPRIARWLTDWPDPADSSSASTWLNERFLRPDGERRRDVEVEAVVREILDARSELRRTGGLRNPTWVVPWEDLRSVMTPGDECWLDPVGVQHTGDPLWMLVLAYPSDRTDVLIRPTQLDSGWYPLHFPSPPRELQYGGHPMDLRSAKPTSLLSEYIHPHIDYDVDDWHLTLICKQVTCTRSVATLAAVRQRHYQLLIDLVSADVRKWMPACM